MITSMYLQHFFLIYTWQDIVEIMVFSWGLYKSMTILAYDSQKPLLRYFLLYSTLIIFSYTFNCTTLQTLLLITAPALSTFFILIHQDTLQRNFVALYRPAVSLKKEIWHLALIQFCQKQASKNYSSAFILEKKQNIESLLTITIPCHATFSNLLGELLYSSPAVYEHHYLLIEFNGTIRGINVSINSHTILNNEEIIHDKELFLTAKTDALILHMDATTLTFTCIHNNKKITDLSAHTITSILNTFFETPNNSIERTVYESTFNTSYKKTELS